MGRVICMVGSATATRADAPVGDPAVEVWSLNDCWQFLPATSARLWFEMHTREHFTGPGRPPGHMEWLQKLEIPVLMPEAHPDIPASQPYPEEDLVLAGYRRYFTSSFAYMLALASHDLVAGDEVRLYGIDLATNTEYERQRPCVEYWLGRLEGKGVGVVVPRACPLLRGPRYGRTDPDEGRRLVQRDTLETRIRELAALKARAGAEMNALQGRIDEAQRLRLLLVDR